MTTKRPNILVIQADQLSANALKAYGNKTVKAPNLDRLATHGVVFESCYCNLPSRPTHIIFAHWTTG